MTTSGDARAPNEGGGVGENFQINEEPQNVCQEAGQNSSSGVLELSTHQRGDIDSICATIGISELKQILKQKTFTRAERQSLITLLQSEESPSNDKRDGEHKHGHESDNFHASVINSKVTASPAELAKGSTSSTDQSQRQDLKLIINNSTCLSKTSVTSPLENLPDELLSNIFVRLLAKQLAQMRSVSKSWNAFLSQSSFIKSHLHHSVHNKSQILLVSFDADGIPSPFEPVTAHLCQSPHLQLPDFIKPPVKHSPRRGYMNPFRVNGCINGLICSAYGDSFIHIWNPSLSTVSTLPPNLIPPGYISSSIHFRFGFDPKIEDYKVVKKIEDYKVVKITGVQGRQCAIKCWLPIEIYSMRKGTWEFITARFPSHITHIAHDRYVCLDGHDGHLHWLGCTQNKSDAERIVAFDLGSETFCEMPLPDAIPGSGNCHNQLAFLAKKLCVMSRNGDDVIEVWVMEEYGVADSWAKRHVFSHFAGDIRPFGFTSRSEFVIVDNGRLVLYDPISKKETILGNYGLEGIDPDNYFLEKFGPEFFFPHHIVEYIDSLVWVAPAGREMLDGGAAQH